MNESKLIDELYKQIKGLKDRRGYFFKRVIKGTIPPLDAVTVFPSVAFYVAESTYEDYKSYQSVESEVLIYIYNRHTTTGLDVEDINTELVMAIRNIVNNELSTDKNVLESYVTKATHDGGAIFPRTIVELSTKIKYIESKDC